MRIITEKRISDWIAYIEGHPEMWEQGNSPEEAISKLKVTRKKLL